MKLMVGSLIRSGAKRFLEPRWVWMKSQPTWAWKNPLNCPFTPSPCPTCGLWGSPSSSEKAWCLRWSATQEMIGPSTAADPSTAKHGARPRPGLEGAVGEEAVEADGDPEAGRDVEQGEDDQVAPVEPAAPDLPGDEAEQQEGHDRERAGDDPVPGLVLDRLDRRGERAVGLIRRRLQCRIRWRRGRSGRRGSSRHVRHLSLLWWSMESRSGRYRHDFSTRVRDRSSGFQAFAENPGKFRQ